MRQNLVYLILLVISAAIFTVFISPYLHERGLTWVSFLFYAIVIITFLYGRSAVLRSRPRR